jgi:CDP-glycerol glycerophosphotransferase (TagB/SpsB family)
VLVPAEKFVLVGRPQVEGIDVRDVGSDLPANPVVLYAPTWRGSLEDSLFGSLRAGDRIVRALLDAGATVMFRPHPYSRRDAESRALITRIDALLGADATRDHQQSTSTAARSIFECINSSDALVTDISSVASDYLYSNKPFAITDPGGLDLRATYPVARAATLVQLSGDDLAAPVAELLGPDTRREQRAEVRSYYLGDWPPEEYPGVFVSAATAAMDGDTPV